MKMYWESFMARSSRAFFRPRSLFRVMPSSYAACGQDRGIGDDGPAVRAKQVGAIS